LPYDGSMKSVDEMILGIKIQKRLLYYTGNKLTDTMFGFNGVYIASVYWEK
jgi:hypothetical protein